MIRVKLHIVRELGLVQLPSHLLHNRPANNGQGTISCGQMKVPVVFSKSGSGGRPIPVGLGADVLAALALSNGATVWASWNSEENRLRLGPVVAVLVWHTNSPGSYHFFGPVTGMVRSFVRLARRCGVIAYAFSARDVNWETGIVSGFVPSGHAWRRVSVPLPDVVYDRLQSRRLDRVKRISICKERLKALPGLHYFNPCFLDKWEVYQALSRDPRARRYLPNTDKLTSPGQIGRWLRSYYTVYIKPTRGSLGLGVTKVSHTASGYRYQCTREGGSRVGVVESLSKLEKQLQAVLPNRRVIIQQGLPLARFAGRPYDIRVMVQKTSRGKWVCTNMIARVASAGSAVSNVSEGGSMISVRRAVSASLAISSRQAVGRIGKGARLIAQAVETQLGKEFGEFGVDMALDTRGRPWLIEVNSKPGRQNDNLPGIPPSIRRVVRYAISKAGF